MTEDRDILNELKTLYEELKSYKRLLNLKGRLSDKDRLRETLVRKIGTLKTKVIELTGKEHIQRFGMVYNIWDVGLTAHRTSSICDVALDYCIDAVNEAIGKLESDIKEGKRDKAGEGIEKPVKEQSLGKKVRKHLQGTPDELAPHIVRVANEFQFQGFNCYAQEESYESTQFSKQLTIYRITDCFTPGVIWGGAKPEELPRTIGVITLQSLPSSKTLLIAKHILSSSDSESSYFHTFLERLSLEFKNLGIEETTVRKAVRWFSRIIELWNKLKP